MKSFLPMLVMELLAGGKSEQFVYLAVLTAELRQ
jgi:hypothetical protein